MITNPKIGEKVWCVMNGVLGGYYPTYHTNAREVEVVEILEEEVRALYMQDSYCEIKFSRCFPSLKSLLEHLEQTAVYYEQKEQQ